MGRVHFLKFVSEVGKSGTLKERDIYRDRTRYLEGLQRLGHKKQDQCPFLPGSCNNRGTRYSNDFAGRHGTKSPGSVIPVV